MPNLYEIIKSDTLHKYPPLPKWVKDRLKLYDNYNDEDFKEWARMVAYSSFIKDWTKGLDD